MLKLKCKFKFAFKIYNEFISGSEGMLAIAMADTCISNKKFFFLKGGKKV